MERRSNSSFFSLDAEEIPTEHRISLPWLFVRYADRASFPFLRSDLIQSYSTHHEVFHTKLITFFSIFNLTLVNPDILTTLRPLEAIATENLGLSLSKDQTFWALWDSDSLSSIESAIFIVNSTVSNLPFLFSISPTFQSPIVVVYSRQSSIVLYPRSFRISPPRLPTHVIDLFQMRTAVSLFRYEFHNGRFYPHLIERSFCAVVDNIFNDIDSGSFEKLPTVWSAAPKVGRTVTGYI
jgi:hypothetical protein